MIVHAKADEYQVGLLIQDFLLKPRQSLDGAIATSRPISHEWGQLEGRVTRARISAIFRDKTGLAVARPSNYGMVFISPRW